MPARNAVPTGETMTSSSHPLQDGSLDPLALLRRSRGDNDLRDTKLRLLWLRQREPEARVRTRLVSLDERAVVMLARIDLPNGGGTSAHAAAPVEAGAIDQIVAETELRALAGALDALGYIVTDTDTGAEPARPEGDILEERATAEAPRRQPPGHVQAIRSLRDREQPAPVAGPEDPRTRREIEDRRQPAEPTPSRSPQRGPAPVDRNPAPPETAPVDLSERRRAAPAEPTAPMPPADDADPELEDISWTAFWTWARETYQIGSRGQVEKLLGMPVDRESPGQLRQMLIAHFEGGSGDES
jgi:hypothetical protein